jgi:hypothetical protein
MVVILGSQPTSEERQVLQDRPEVTVEKKILSRTNVNFVSELTLGTH